MKVFRSIVLAALVACCSMAEARVRPAADGFEVSYEVRIFPGTSNGSAIRDVLIVEWNESGDISAEFAPDIAPRGRTVLSHVIAFEPSSALVLGWGAAVPGFGDEKDHLFTLAGQSFTARATGLKWSDAFPGVPPEPRTGHSAMISLMRDAAGGDPDALDAVVEWAMRDGEDAAFDPAGRFRVMEWSIGFPIDNTPPIPAAGPFGLALLALVLLMFGARTGPARWRRLRHR